MVYPPRPNNITIPAVIAGNILQSGDTSVSVLDSGFDGSIVMRTENELAMIIDEDQKVLINTENASAQITVNNDSSLYPTMRLSYQDQYHIDFKVNSDGNATIDRVGPTPTLSANLSTIFYKNVDIIDHNGTTRGLKLGNVLITASASELNYVDVPVGIAQANKALVLNSNRDISGINSLSATTLNGTLAAGPQNNITQLTNVALLGTITLNGTNISSTIDQLNYLTVPSIGTAFPGKALITDLTTSITGINQLTATNIFGQIMTGPQPNITQLSGLTSITNNGTSALNGQVIITSTSSDQLRIINNTATAALSLNGGGEFTIKANNIRTDIGSDLYVSSHNGSTKGLYLGSFLVQATATQLNYNRVIPGTASPTRSLVVDSLLNIAGINDVSANTLTGTLTTNFQPNINRVNLLNISNHNGSTSGLRLNNTLVLATAEQLNYNTAVPGIASATKSLIVDSSKNISSINRLEAVQLAGTILTELQPNIRTVNTLTITEHNGVDKGLRLGSTLVIASGDQINRVAVDAGIASPNKALVVDSSKNIIDINNISAASVSGLLTTGNQPNISSVNVLNIANHNGTIGLSLAGTLITATAAQINRLNVAAGIVSPSRAVVVDSANSISGFNILSANSINGTLLTATQPNIRNLSTIDVQSLLLNGVAVSASAFQLNFVDTTQGTAVASKALIVDGAKRITGITGLAADELTGMIMTTNQPNINRVNTLNIAQHNGSTTGLSLSGDLVRATAAQLNRTISTEGVASASRAVVLDSTKSIIGINVLSADTINGTITSTFQPNITSVNTLNVINHNGTNGLSLAGTLITASAAQINRVDVGAGSATAGKALVVDNSRNITNINSISATSITGTLATGSQPNITSVNVLDITGHNGSIGLRLNGVLVSASANQLNYNTVVPGIASSLKSMITNDFNSISGLNQLSATKLVAQELQLAGVVANFNTGAWVIKSYSFTDLIGRLIDIQLMESSSISNFIPGGQANGYSCEIIGYILPEYSESYTFFITCNDRVRLWVNGTQIIHSWTPSSLPRTSSTIFLNANQWVPIYAQFQVDTGSIGSFLLEWSSNNTSRGIITASRLAWDNNAPATMWRPSMQNSLTIYNTSTASSNNAVLSVDNGGDLTIDASGNDVLFGSGDNVNIPAHDGVSRGLFLGGVLVRPTAFELNYLKVSPGVVSASQALVVDASKSISGLNSVTATSIACTSLTTNAFTISNLSLSGPLNNYNTGSLLIRQITGPDVSGRVVDVNTITDINLVNYDPRELNSNYSLDIIGYILPSFTETYRFFAIANDRVRIWVANQLILNVWDTNDGLEYTSADISLVAGQWTPIYIQFQNITGSSSLQVRWQSTTQVKSFIPFSAMAWDNSFVRIPRGLSSSDSFTLYSSANGLKAVRSGLITIDGTGTMTMSSTNSTIQIATGNNFNIAGHNSTTTGLRLAGTLVTASAGELNYLSGATPGTVVASKAIILDANRALSGLLSITSTDIFGTIRTPAQPFITSFGTLSSTLNSSSDILLTNSTTLRLSTDSTASRIMPSADLIIGSNRIVSRPAALGIQTSVPNRPVSINGAGAAYALRLINNNSSGTETSFVDIGCDTSSNLLIASNMILGVTNPASITVNSSGVMKIAPVSALQVGNTTNTSLPLEIGSSAFTLSGTNGYLNNEGSVGKLPISDTLFSLRTTGSVIVNGTVCVTSDERLKDNITDINEEDCVEFVKNSRPVSFTYKNQKNTQLGLIAQDVANTKFANLVKMIPEESLPDKQAMSVSYEEIIPILLLALKNQQKQIDELTKKINDMN